MFNTSLNDKTVLEATMKPMQLVVKCQRKEKDYNLGIQFCFSKQTSTDDDDDTCLLFTK